MFGFSWPKKKNPESAGITLFGGDEGETTIASNPEEIVDANDYIISHTPTTPEYSSLQDYRTQKSLDVGELRIDAVATQKKREHAAALAALTEAKVRGEDDSVIAKLQQRVHFLQLHLNEMRKDGFIPFSETDDIEAIEEEIRRLEFFQRTDDNLSPDLARQDKTFEMLFAAKAKLLEATTETEAVAIPPTDKRRAPEEV